MTVDVGKDRGPAVAVDVVNRQLVSDFQGMAGDGLLDKVVVIAMLNEEKAAVEDVDAVVAVLGPAGKDDAIAVGGAGVHGRTRGGDFEDSTVNLIGRYIYDGEVRFYRIRNQQAPNDLLVMVIALVHVIVMVVVALIHVIVMMVLFGELQGIDTIAKGDYAGLIGTGVVHEFPQPAHLKAKTDRQHNVCIGHLGNVTRSWHKTVRIGTGWLQAEYLNPIPAYHFGPVSHNVGGGYDLERRA